jgi:hypothetical protein
MKTTSEIYDEKLKALKPWIHELEQVLHRKAWNEFVMSCEYDSDETKDSRIDRGTDAALNRIFREIKKL